LPNQVIIEAQKKIAPYKKLVSAYKMLHSFEREGVFNLNEDVWIFEFIKPLLMIAANLECLSIKNLISSKNGFLISKTAVFNNSYRADLSYYDSQRKIIIPIECKIPSSNEFSFEYPKNGFLQKQNKKISDNEQMSIDSCGKPYKYPWASFYNDGSLKHFRHVYQEVTLNHGKITNKKEVPKSFNCHGDGIMQLRMYSYWCSINTNFKVKYAILTNADQWIVFNENFLDEKTIDEPINNPMIAFYERIDNPEQDILKILYKLEKIFYEINFV
jgi:hypothetical protein